MPPDRILIWLAAHAAEIPDMEGGHQVYAINASDDVSLASARHGPDFHSAPWTGSAPVHCWGMTEQLQAASGGKKA